MPNQSLNKALGVTGLSQRIEKIIRKLFQAQRTAFLVGSATYDAANLVDGAGATTTITVTGAALGDFVVGVSHSVDLAGITVTGYVSAANTVSVRFQNESGGAVDLASGTLRAVVLKRSSMNGTAYLGIEP